MSSSKSSDAQSFPVDMPGRPRPSFTIQWLLFDPSSNEWQPPTTTSEQDTAQTHRTSGDASLSSEDTTFGIVTWNIDAFAAHPQERAEALLSRILDIGDHVDIIFLQEVSKSALSYILGDVRVRTGWFSSDSPADSESGFRTLTLLSRRRFALPNDKHGGHDAVLGPVWRVLFQSYFARDALCCDVLLSPPAPTSDAGPRARNQESVRLRLINVHLDSLALAGSCRPRQVAVVAALLREAGHGLVAGDFNPVQPFDATLVEENGLEDAWVRVHGAEEPGLTWGLDRKTRFPPARLDKIATLGIDAQSVEILYPEMVGELPKNRSGHEGEDEDVKKSDNQVAWSDHCGLFCKFRVAANL